METYTPVVEKKAMPNMFLGENKVWLQSMYDF